ncbi:MAG: trypsin-like peptidase domain-containing protein [Pseudoclavibacter sp.]|nr:trypsin-like peptidase domain-containing protein [Pseudoclavibacter sp.]
MSDGEGRGGTMERRGGADGSRSGPPRSIPPRARAAAAARRELARRAAAERAASLREGVRTGRERPAAAPRRGMRLRTATGRQPARRYGLRALALVALLAALAGGAGGAVASGLLRSLSGAEAMRPMSPQGGPAAADVRAAAAAAAPSVVTLRISAGARNEVASGIVLSAEGHVLTNAHVVTLDGTVADAEITATTADGRVFATERVGLDPLADVAVLSLTGASGLAPARFADSDRLETGQPAIVLGAPLGLSNTVTSGIVSAVQRSIEIDSGAEPEEDEGSSTGSPDPGRIHLSVFQTDADTNPGNSGGPVVNERGEEIGVSVAIATTATEGANGPAEGSIGLGFAIHANTALRVAEELMAGRTPTHGALGASLKASDAQPGASPGLPGARIDGLSRNGAAARSGLRRGDVVVAVDEVPVVGPGDLIARVRAAPAGTEVRLTVLREGRTIPVRVVLDEAA